MPPNEIWHGLEFPELGDGDGVDAGVSQRKGVIAIIQKHTHLEIPFRVFCKFVESFGITGGNRLQSL